MDELLLYHQDTGRLADELIDSYDILQNCEVQFLKYSENLTYMVTELEKKKKYVLRIYRPGYHQKDEMIGELVWICQLKKDTDIKIASVYAGQDGKLIQNINFGKENGQKVSIALFEFIEGSTLQKINQEEMQFYIGKIGEITARFHSHVIQWKGSRDLKRFSWDLQNLIGKHARWGRYDELQALTDEQRRVYDDAVDLIEKRLKKYGKSKDKYGLIHSDLNINNILVTQEDIFVIDFDDCGFGWFLYDLATSVLEFFGTELEDYIKIWVDGYEKYRKLSKEDIEEIMTFVVLRKIVRIGWIATHLNNDTVKKVKSDYYEQTARLAEEYIKQCTI